MIRIYIVGIHFNQQINFKADSPAYVKQANGTYLQAGPDVFMKGSSILAAAAAKFGLRYVLSNQVLYPQPSHLEYVSYTPTAAHDPNPRVTFGSSFPFYGQQLALTEALAPIGQPSQILQYTVQWPKGGAGPFPTPTPVTLNNTGTPDPNFPAPPGFQRDAAFGGNGFPDNIEIRIRLLTIYCTY